MVRVEFSPQAKDDLREIWLTIAEDNPEAADRVVAEVKKSSMLLESQPKMGTKRFDYQDGLYMWVMPKFRNYLVFYRKGRRSDSGDCPRATG